jgi:hypothetical protein
MLAARTDSSSPRQRTFAQFLLVSFERGQLIRCAHYANAYRDRMSSWVCVSALIWLCGGTLNYGLTSKLKMFIPRLTYDEGEIVDREVREILEELAGEGLPSEAKAAAVKHMRKYGKRH